MFLGEDEKLDYEEDELSTDSPETNSQSENFSWSNDQYLQIDCPEEENFFSSKATVENVCGEKENVKKDSEDAENVRHNNHLLPSSKKFNLTNDSGNSNDSKGETAKSANTIATSINAAVTITTITTTTTTTTTNTNTTRRNPEEKKRKCSKPFNPRPEIKEKIPNGSSHRPRLPDRSLLISQNMKTPRFPLWSDQQKTLNRDYHPNQRFHTLNSFSPREINSKGRGPSRRRKPFSRSWHKSLSQSQTENEKSVNVEYKNAEPKIITRNKNFRKMSAFEQKLNIRTRKKQENNTEIFQNVEAKRNFKRPTFDVQNRGGPNSDRFSRKNKNNFLDHNLLKDDEKKLINLRKEARLLRFCHDDDMVRKEKIPNGSALDKIDQSSIFEEEYFKKMAEQKLARERYLSLKEQKIILNCSSDQDGLLERPNINKESLLKKRNPFDGGSEGSGVLFGTKIKQENERDKEIKKECIDHKAFKFIKIEPQCVKDNRNILTTSGSAGQSFCSVKSETKSPVKFFRTVSKCFDELTSKKHKAEVIFNNNKNESPFSQLFAAFPTTEEKEKNSLTCSFPAQIDSQLTGCIVKVLNIPPLTTTNDILALCCPIGVVREVKLNFPKENSVVIRFVEPACAEKFFSLYHGQKMNDYFLNVIIV